MQHRFGTIEYQLKRRAVKHMRIQVLPPNGAVQVIVPHHASDSAIAHMLEARTDWIIKHQQNFLRRPQPIELQWVSGEQHYLWGSAYLLELIEQQGKHQVLLKQDNRLQLRVRPDTDTANKAKVMQAFYRQQLEQEVPALLEKWQPRMGVTVNEWRSKQMKTRWGTCNINAKRIWLNVELVKKPYSCLEYVVVHELAHLIHLNHSPAFHAVVQGVLPDWKQRKTLLKHPPD